MYLSILTWNILRSGKEYIGLAEWTARRDSLRQSLACRNHDVSCFQEVSADQLLFLQEALPHCQFAGVGRDDGKDEGVSCPVFFSSTRFEINGHDTFWFRPDHNTPGKGWGELVPRICTWVELRERSSGTSFRVYNAHMQLNPFAQKQAALLLIEQLGASRLPVVLVGDLNTSPFSPTVRLLQNSGFQDANERRLRSFQILGTPLFRPDHVITDDAWRVERFNVIRDHVDGIFPSDHFGLESMLRLTGCTI